MIVPSKKKEIEKMSDQLMFNMPIGFRFDPTDEELISGFLLPKVMGIPLPWNGFLERDLYGENAAPWEVFGDIDESSSYWHTKKESDNSKGFKKTIYVFTKLTKVGSNSNSNSKRVSRRAGCGTWNGQTGPRKIKDSKNGEIIGTTRMLSFQHSKTIAADSSEREMGSLGHWIMHEYALDGQRKSDLVLCKITKCLKQNDRRQVQPAAPPQFCFSTSSNGSAASDIQFSRDSAAEVSKKRSSAEECQQSVEDAFENKKQKLCDGNYTNDVDTDDLFVWFDGIVEKWDYSNDDGRVDDRLLGFDETVQSWNCSNQDRADDLLEELNRVDDWNIDELLQRL